MARLIISRGDKLDRELQLGERVVSAAGPGPSAAATIAVPITPVRASASRARGITR